MSKLTVHVLDMASGVSAHGMRLRLTRVEPFADLLIEKITAADGRCAPAVLEGEAFCAGKYRLVFELAEYFQKQEMVLEKPMFLSQAIIEFHVAPDQNYHIPLIVTPFSYSVYRGS
jgi:5-hydroxyisourate hydrolase